MADLIQTVIVNVEYCDGLEEGDVGHPYYVASSDELNFVTDGDTFEELLSNLREVLTLCLTETDSVVEYGVSHNAKVQFI